MAKMISDLMKQKAACKGHGPEIFYADSGPLSSKTVKSNIIRAKALCNSCIIQSECLMNAINNGEEFGIWGGMTGKERASMFEGIDEIEFSTAEEVVQWLRSIS